MEWNQLFGFVGTIEGSLVLYSMYCTAFYFDFDFGSSNAYRIYLKQFLLDWAQSTVRYIETTQFRQGHNGRARTILTVTCGMSLCCVSVSHD
mmetsp:Transcript_10787/g.23011  ORF Transcript_10787/g.23011 Transcript_10787/m.23011 type:complete len:92 (-) Transcript_10787:116-391(-)